MTAIPDDTTDTSGSALHFTCDLRAESCRSQPVPPENLALMRRLDELHLEYPFAGARMLRDLLCPEALHRRTRTFKCHPAHPVLS